MSDKPAILQLTIKRKWFDLIAVGIKKAEYRTPSKWILSRLEGRGYDTVRFRNGYSANSPVVECKYLGWERGYGRKEWGGDPDSGKVVIVIKLGDLVSLKCPECGADPYPEVDICDACAEKFGHSGVDGNGFNCTCVSCGESNIYTQCCGKCWEVLPVEMWN